MVAAEGGPPREGLASYFQLKERENMRETERERERDREREKERETRLGKTTNRILTGF
jgi:hypothetical protein